MFLTVFYTALEEERTIYLTKFLRGVRDDLCQSLGNVRGV